MKDCRFDCFECPYPDCVFEGMRTEDFDSEMLVDRLLGNCEDLRRTRKARHYILNFERFRERNRKNYERRKHGKSRTEK